jgi:hypothetical protein
MMFVSVKPVDTEIVSEIEDTPFASVACTRKAVGSTPELTVVVTVPLLSLTSDDLFSVTVFVEMVVKLTV